ncbi:UPF0149 family protein [Bradyrhizobium sp. 35]|uniref:UPF0149 family protein n=1 Tax=Bradyrhizobium sp. 35 TaxID=2782670 RepID=UPI003211A97E
MRHNEIRQTLSTAPKQFAPMHRREANGDVDACPWCQGFYAVMRLRLPAWAPSLDASNVNHRLLLPILRHCRDDQGCPLLGPPRNSPDNHRKDYWFITVITSFCRAIRGSASFPAARGFRCF